MLDAYATTGQSPGLKKCSTCHATKALTEFRSDAHAKGGLYALCRPCEAESRARPGYYERERARKVAGNPTWRQRRAAREAMTPESLHPTPSQLADLLLKRGFRCAYCGEHGVDTFDHIIPLSRGGAHTAANLVPADTACNRRKATRTAEEFGFPTLVGQTLAEVSA